MYDTRPDLRTPDWTDPKLFLIVVKMSKGLNYGNPTGIIHNLFSLFVPYIFVLFFPNIES